MIIADTNVIARIFIKDNPAQVAEVERFLENIGHEEELVYLPATVLVELVWILRQRLEKSHIIAALEYLTESPDFVIGHRQAVTQALAWYRAGKADFADYLIHADGILAGAKGLVTFDETFAKEDKKRRKRPRAWRK